MRCSERTTVLDQAIEDQGLQNMLSPVAAVTFGVIPIQKRKGTLLVACGETWLPACKSFVERAVGMPIETVPFRDSVIRHYTLKAYAENCMVNHNTFPDPDFIQRPESFHLLVDNKVDEVGPVGSELPSHRLVLLDVTYSSLLHNLDGRRSTGQFFCGRMELPFRTDGSSAEVHADEIEDSVFLIMRINCFHDAVERDADDTFHGIHSVYLDSLPYMVHPSEIQITQVGVDGSVTFYLYDRLETLRPGQTATWPIRYYFMSLGNRHSRDLTLQVHTLAVVDREQVTLTDRPIEWADEDLRRWFRLDEKGRL